MTIDNWMGTLELLFTPLCPSSISSNTSLECLKCVFSIKASEYISIYRTFGPFYIFYISSLSILPRVKYKKTTLVLTPDEFNNLTAECLAKYVAACPFIYWISNLPSSWFIQDIYLINKDAIKVPKICILLICKDIWVLRQKGYYTIQTQKALGWAV